MSKVVSAGAKFKKWRLLFFGVEMAILNVFSSFNTKN